MEAIIGLIGNDGVGKSVIASLLNAENGGNIWVVERSSKSTIPEISMFDKMTLLYPFEKEFTSFELPEKTQEGIPIYWVVLDCEIPTILGRIKERQVSDIWETPKSLFYFRARFRHLAAHFGLPLINTTHLSKTEVCEKIMEVVKNKIFYEAYRKLGTKYLTYELVDSLDLEKILYEMMGVDENMACDEVFSTVNNMGEKVCENNMGENKMGENGCENVKLPEYAKEYPDMDLKRLYVRQYVNSHSPFVTETSIIIGKYVVPRSSCFLLLTEGESKKVYVDISGNPYTQGLAFICLKSTIYSHSMQATGMIEGLGEIRATGTQLYLEMMWRNGLKHSYHSINQHGIIISDWIECTPLEIVIKRFCEGTDKHSFHLLRDNSDLVIPTTGEYKSGPYMRTDWRNPNHVNSQNEKLNAHMFYYLYEEHAGKNNFFDTVLRNPLYAKPFGDKCVPEDIVSNIIDVEETRKSLFQMFATIQAYFSEVGLLMKDGCFMLDKLGTTFWSEINQDCMRIVTVDNSNTFDKDLWRAGGSGSKDTVRQKWIQFNDIFKAYFLKHRFDKTEMLAYHSYKYQKVVEEILNDNRLQIPHKLLHVWHSLYSFYTNKRAKRVIFTMDMYDGKPVLVQSGVVSEVHFNGNWEEAMNTISIYPNILVVDLNGALKKPNPVNRDIIKKLGVSKYIHTGGGLHTLSDIQDVLGSSIRRVVLGSASNALIAQVPKERLIVELSVDQDNKVLIDGRKTNTHIHILDRLEELAELGVNVISITFHQTEGHLKGIPQEQIRKLVLQIPKSFQKIIIAGGITSLEDLEFLWSLERVIPQLGSAIWKKKLTMGEVIAQTIFYDEHGLTPAVIQDINGMVKGLVYLNKEAVIKTCDQKVLWRYSRKEKRLMMKGATSGDIQHVLSVSSDCDSDTLLITVDSAKPMCHTGNFSCFPIQTVAKTSVTILRDHLKTKNSGSYAGKMQEKPALALAKVMEEFWEIVTAPLDAQIHEIADMFIHLMMYLNGIGIQFEDVLNELNKRRWDPYLIDSTPKYKQRQLEYLSQHAIIGITGGKYSGKTDHYVEEHLGIKITRGENRSLLVTGTIVNREKYTKWFGNKTFCFVTARPKDMAWLMAVGRINYAVSYETAIKNFPEVYRPVHEVVDPTIALCLIKRQGEIIDPKNWSVKNRVLIAAEHIRHVSQWMEKAGIPSEYAHLDRIIGSSEGFLLQTNMYTLCDAVVESGKTLTDNNLEVYETIIPKGQVLMGLYQRI